MEAAIHYCRALVPSQTGLALEVPCGAEVVPGSSRCLPHTFGLRITPAERNVLRHVLHGLRNKEIAAQMHIAERTVKFHISSLLQKFGVESRTELAIRAGLKLENAAAKGL